MKLIVRMRTRTKLGLAFFVVLVLMGASGVVSLSQASRINASTVEIADNWLPSIHLLADLKDQMNQARRAELRHLLETDPIEKARLRKTIAQADTRFRQLMGEYRPLVVSPEEQVLYERLQPAWRALLRSMTESLSLSDQGPASLSKSREIACGEGLQAYVALSTLIDQDMTLNHLGARGAAGKAENDYAEAKGLLLAFVALSLLCSAALGVALTRSVTQPLGAEPWEINETMLRLAGGDLRALSA